MAKLISLCLFVALLCISSYADNKKYFSSNYFYEKKTDSFYKKHTSGKTWQDAKHTCEAEGAILFYPESKAEADVVISSMKRDGRNDNIWMGIFKLNDVFTTIGGVPLSETYHNWADGEPNNLGGIEACVSLEHSGLMYDTKCNQDLNFVCKKRPFVRKDYFYDDSQGNFYKRQAIPRAWRKAKKNCELDGAKLFYPDSKEEANVVLAHLKKENRNYNIWLGISRHNGVFTNIDGLRLENGYSNWAIGEPSDNDGNEDCVSLDKSGLMYDSSCSNDMSYVCKKTLHLRGDYSYEKSVDGFYKSHGSKTFENAKETCESEGATLFYPENKEESEAVRAYLRRVNQNDNIWLGIHKTRGEFLTMDGNPLKKTDYQNWANGEPNNLGGLEDCASLEQSGLMYDTRCNQDLNFVCKQTLFF